MPQGSRVTLRLFVQSANLPAAVTLFTSLGEAVPMRFDFDMCGGRMYVCTLSVSATLFYYFLVNGDGEQVYYGNNAACLGGFGDISAGEPLHKFQITAYAPSFRCPAAFSKGIVYQIFPDRFRRGGEAVSVGIPRAWGETPFFCAEQFGGTYTSGDFFGGTLYGILEKLPYLADLGITYLYLNPIFDSSSNHGYNTRDYRHIAAHFGGDAAFRALAAEAKKVGISLILDGVFSHTGSDSPYFQAALSDENSPYRAWYSFNDSAVGYDCWWGIPSLPNVRETEPSYLDFMLRNQDSVVRQWLRAGSAGWRLDVADELPDVFLDTLREVVKEENPDAVIIGEVWEDASNKESYGAKRRYLTGAQLDSVMNYPLRNSILDFICGRIDAVDFQRRVMSLAENYPPMVFYSTLNFLSCHDVPRLLTVLGNAPTLPDRAAQSTYRLPPENRAIALQRLPLALLLQLTLPGVPCLYYGDEVGMEGYGDPFNRGCYPWGKEDDTVFSIYQSLLALRQNEPDFTKESFSFLYAAGRAIAFCRGNTIVALNAGAAPAELDLPMKKLSLGAMEYTVFAKEESDENYNAGYNFT